MKVMQNSKLACRGTAGLCKISLFSPSNSSHILAPKLCPFFAWTKPMFPLVIRVIFPVTGNNTFSSEPLMPGFLQYLSCILAMCQHKQNFW
ncbi:hypothetical protein ACJIZ3_009648 [Penstemon smallii]|uniref:Uncharacterized protein n=1 Tax=Penstemon smallii TaxID=265156 RepID=A0ABD3TDN2_9LAMI